MKTFEELYSFLQLLPDTDIKPWLSSGKWKGKDKQESVLRLFGRLGLIAKINDFNMCKGNFNLTTLQPIESIRDIFFNSKNKKVCLKDKGDSSDLTGINKSNPKHIFVCTSKCINRLSIKKLDIDYINTNLKQYEEQGYTATLGIAVKETQELKSVLERTEKTSVELKKFIQNHNTVFIDHNDINEAYHNFKRIYGNTLFQDLIAIKKSPLLPRLHQELCRIMTMRLKSITNKIIWGHVQRSGKSYMMGCVIIEDSNGKSKCNYLVMTTAPNETILQYRQVFDCSQLHDFNVVHLDGKSKKPILKDKNIIICSKQFLQSKSDQTTTIPWLKNMEFDMRFVDESHHGGTTLLAKKTLDYYGDGSFTIYITATYSKPVQDYNIPRAYWILWDLEDINLCKRIDEEKNVERLMEKHGDDMKNLLQQYSTENIIADFSKYPDLEILTKNINPEILPEILKETGDNLYGWSTDACFLLKQGVDNEGDIVYQPEFQNKKEFLKLFYTIFGKRDKFGVPDKDYPDELVFMKRIEKICKNPMTSSRFVDDLDQNVIIAFLPPNNIDIISQTTKHLLEKENVTPDYDILCINSKTTTDPKQAILDAKIKAKNMGKKGVLVLSGRQCSLGVTIDDCDIVLLLNNSNSYDMIFQMMFRCMTEGTGKKRGFVIDPNIHRVVDTILLEYGYTVKPDAHPKDAIRYLLQERLINLNSDHWQPCFGHGSSKLTALTDSIYEVYSSRMSGALDNLFRRMSLKQDLFSKNDYDMMRCIFDNLPISKVETIQKEEMLKKGIEKILATTEQQPINVDDDREEDDEKKINPVDILRPVSVIVSFLTIHDGDKTTLEEMYSLVEKNHQKKSILLNQVRLWWGKKVSNKDVEVVVGVFTKYLEKDNQTAILIRQVKELLCKNIRNSTELSKIIDKFLIPQENEKKKNAEVSTPRQLRQEMLDEIPEKFWTQKKKVLEPCCGKGGFLIDIVDRFMKGWKDKYHDEKQRYKKIVEECLYFSDINDMNIFICRLLLDPYNEYNLNYNIGDTLQLDIKKKWGVEGFDAEIGNPPYNSSGNTGTGNTIWQLFVDKAFEWTRKGKGRYVVLVHPSGWRKPNTEKGKFTGLYHKMVSENYMRRLSIHGVKDGMKTFHCGTRYDWYVIERIEGEKRKTRITDEKGQEVEEKMGEGWEWFPNHSHEKVKRLLAQEGEEKCPIIQSMSAYEPRKSWMSKVKDEKHPYPCIHSTPKSGVRYMYSSINNKGMFGVPKIIFGDSGQYNVVADLEGVYGMTHHSMGIEIRDIEECNKLIDCLQSDSFSQMVDMCSWSTFSLDWNIFKYFKRDFWKHLV